MRKRKKSGGGGERRGGEHKEEKGVLDLSDSRDSSLLIFSSSDLRMIWRCVRGTEMREINHPLCVLSVQTSIAHSSATEQLNAGDGGNTLFWYK